MIQNTNKHPKQGFQVDRIAFFSDAVFAIVITLLVIELKPPHVDIHSTPQEILGELSILKFNFLSIILSFFIVAKQWLQHHFLFKYIHDYDKKILWASLIMLLPIIFFPFSTAFFAETTENQNITFIGMRVFILNTLFSVITLMYFYYVTFLRSKSCTYEIPENEKKKFFADILNSLIFSVIILVFTYMFENFKMIAYPFIALPLLKFPINYLLGKINLKNF